MLKSSAGQSKRIIAVGAVLAGMGLVCLLIKALTPEHVDAAGMLHEAFFLLPIGFLLLFVGAAIVLAAAIRRRVKR